MDVHDPAITVKFRMIGEEDTFFLAWTTTPWTLPSNLALAVGPDIGYVKVRDGNENYILAKESLSGYYKKESDYRIVREMKGSDLVGMRYEPLFPYFAGLVEKGAFKVFAADYVTAEDGSGIVHTAPGFGEDDYNTLKGTGIPVVCPIDGECRFTEEVSDYAGRFVKEADKDIIARLKAEGKLVKRDQYLHAYPHCWRCKSPLIYRAVSSWFVDIGKIKESMVAANRKVFWVPAHIRDGRFGNWLERSKGLGDLPQPVLGESHPHLALRILRQDDLPRQQGGTRGEKRGHGRRSAQTLRGRDHDPLLLRRRDEAYPRGSGLLVRVRVHALRAKPLPLREQGEIRGEFSRRLHLRGARSDARLVLYAHDSRRRPLRQSGLQGLCRERSRPGRGRQEDVEVGEELLRSRRGHE
jgi:hypothetical protein